MGKIISYDLGTTNSVVSVMENGEAKVIVNSEGSRTTPSVVAFTKDGEILVGAIAKRQAVTNPESTVFSAKSFIGRRFSECETRAKKMPYKVVPSNNGDAAVVINGKQMAIPEISAKVLQKLKRDAEAYLGETVTECIVTVPARFNSSERAATQAACTIAGLECKRVINEPTAAALLWAEKSGNSDKEKRVMVVDLGGGTADFSVLEIGSGVTQVVSTNGNVELGGDNADQYIINWLIDEFKKSSGLDVSKDKMVLQRLKEAAEQAKVELSALMEVSINLPFLTADASGPKHLQATLSRAKFDQMMVPWIQEMMIPLRKALEDAKKTPDQIDEIILVGGSTRIPLVQETLRKFFNKEPDRSLNPDEAVSLGAALQAGIISGEKKDLVLLDVLPLSIGIETQGAVTTIMIPRNTTIPTQKREIFSTAADNQDSVEVHILQGERVEASKNRTLGRFHLGGILPASRGVPRIEITLDVDANGILNVTAKDTATGKENKITITGSGGLSDADIKRMVTEAQENEAADKQRKEEIERRNKLDNLCYSTEKLMTEHKDKLGDTTTLSSILVEARSAVEKQDDTSIQEVTPRLEAEMQRLSMEIYNKAAAEQAAQQAASQQASEGVHEGTVQPEAGPKVVDAEFTDTAS